MGFNVHVLAQYISLLYQNVYHVICNDSNIEAVARRGGLLCRSRSLLLMSWKSITSGMYTHDLPERQSALGKLSAATVSISSVLESPSSLVSFLAMSYSKLPVEVRRMPHSLLTPVYEEESFNIDNIEEKDDHDGESQHEHACRSLRSLTITGDFALEPLANEAPISFPCLVCLALGSLTPSTALRYWGGSREDWADYRAQDVLRHAP
jgi:hypothetical protein